MTRNLQAIGSGAADVDQYITLVQWEADTLNNVRVPEMTSTDIENIKTEFNQLCNEWDLIPENGKLQLTF